MGVGVDTDPTGLERDAGGGGVAGPGSSTDNVWPRFDGTGGETLQDGQWAEADDGSVLAGGALDMNSSAVSGVTTLALSGAITQAADTDVVNIFGRLVTYAPTADTIGIAHIDQYLTANQYALRHFAGGHCILSSKAGTYTRINSGTLQRFEADATGLGFYGHATVAQQTGVAVSAAGIHAALVATGLITA